MTNNRLSIRQLALYASCGAAGAVAAYFVAKAALPLFAGTAFWVLPVTLIGFIGLGLAAFVLGLSWADARKRAPK